MRVLVVEGAPAILREHVRSLRRRGLAVDGERTTKAATRSSAIVAYDALVVGRRLADGDGIELARRLLERMSVIALAAGSDPLERITLLRAGVDDCLIPPVGADELALRIVKAVLRRAGAPARVRVGAVLVDRIRRQVTVDGRVVELTPRQMAVLDHLVAHRHRVVTPAELLEHCWDARLDMFSNPLPSQISQLRARLAGGLEITWTAGVGFLLVPVGDPDV